MATECIKVNADYESVLFRKQPGPLANHAIEFLAFYLQELPLLTDIEYNPDYLKKVEAFSGKVPRTVKSGNAQNWWGPLQNIEHEKWLNSKITSTKLAIEEGWSSARIISREEAEKLKPEEELILKDPFGMSGRGVINLFPDKEVHIPKSFQGELIVEPKLDRKFDFSNFVFPDGQIVCYENLVDERFQYRGTIIEDGPLTVESLSFAHLISDKEWSKFH